MNGLSGKDAPNVSPKSELSLACIDALLLLDCSNRSGGDIDGDQK